MIDQDIADCDASGSRQNPLLVGEQVKPGPCAGHGSMWDVKRKKGAKKRALGVKTHQYGPVSFITNDGAMLAK